MICGKVQRQSATWDGSKTGSTFSKNIRVRSLPPTARQVRGEDDLISLFVPIIYFNHRFEIMLTMTSWVIPVVVISWIKYLENPYRDLTYKQNLQKLYNNLKIKYLTPTDSFGIVRFQFSSLFSEFFVNINEDWRHFIDYTSLIKLLKTVKNNDKWRSEVFLCTNFNTEPQE